VTPDDGTNRHIKVNSTYLLNIIKLALKYEPGSSVSVVSGYGLDDRAIDVRSMSEKKGFLL
jgi:hypothetical protein